MNGDWCCSGGLIFWMRIGKAKLALMTLASSLIPDACYVRIWKAGLNYNPYFFITVLFWRLRGALWKLSILNLRWALYRTQREVLVMTHSLGHWFLKIKTKTLTSFLSHVEIFVSLLRKKVFWGDAKDVLILKMSISSIFLTNISPWKFFQGLITPFLSSPFFSCSLCNTILGGDCEQHQLNNHMYKRQTLR